MGVLALGLVTGMLCSLEYLIDALHMRDGVSTVHAVL